MTKISEWKLAQKIQASGKKGMIIGLSIAALVCLIIAIVIIKSKFLKKLVGCGKGDFAEAGEEDCCYTSDKDFV